MMRGQCLCGTIEFQLDGAAPTLYQCHCTLCRKQGGSASNTGAIVESRLVTWLSGEQRISSFVRPTGFRSDFCSVCGSPVPNPLRDTGFTWVPAGLLDESEKPRIAFHLFTGSRASWDTAPLSGTLYETMPEMTEFIGELHAGAAGRTSR